MPDVVSSPSPGLILLDLNMPKKDGREALREIKAAAELRRIPIVGADNIESRGGYYSKL